MNLKLNGKTVRPSDFENGKITEKNLTATELRVLEIIQKWNHKEDFIIQTSGSTGNKKSIVLPHEILKYSALTSLDYLSGQAPFHSSLLCINANFIGGLMVVIRALASGMDLDVIEPSINPFSQLDNPSYDVISLVPLQVQSILESVPEKFRGIKHVIIGGAPLAEKYIQSIREIEECHFWHSYGMTETASHIALKNLKTENVFKKLGDIQLDVDETNCLKIKGTVTQHQWLQTSDMVRLFNSKSFEWIGRADHIINSGGIKLNPESIEDKLVNTIPEPFFISGVPDENLGQKVVLVVCSERRREIDVETLEKYEKPKEIIFLDKFVYTPNNKIDRLETMKLIP